MKDMKDVPRFTIIVPVVHSVEDLDRCLTSLKKLDYPADRFRVALVDCGIAPGLSRRLVNLPPSDPLELHTFALPPAEGKPVGPYMNEYRVNEARNRAIEQFPAEFFVFTEDDCVVPAGWLRKIDEALNDRTGMLGGPDVLPENMSPFTHVVDAILNSFLGTAGMRGGGKVPPEQYYPHKENTVIPSRVLDEVGKFPEENFFGGEMEMADRIRRAGYAVDYMEDNPVVHRRVITLKNFLLLTAVRASEKIRLMGKNNPFLKTLRRLVPGIAVLLLLLAVLSLFIPPARAVLAGFCAIYAGLLALPAVAWAIRKRSPAVGLGVLLVMPLYHGSILLGVLSGILRGRTP